MLFLAFDMENGRRSVDADHLAMGPSAVIEMFVFLAILLSGVTNAWREGALRWT